MFAITRGTGFHVTFANGWTVSVQWGPCTYSDNHDSMEFDVDKRAPYKSTTAEVAVWGPDGILIEQLDGDTVASYQTPADVLGVLIATAARVA